MDAYEFSAQVTGTGYVAIPLEFIDQIPIKTQKETQARVHNTDEDVDEDYDEHATADADADES